MTLLRDVPRSLSVQVGDAPAHFSTRKDYVQHLLATDQLRTGDDLCRQEFEALVVAVYRDWQNQGQLACQFARTLAADPGTYGLTAQVISGRLKGPSPHQIVDKVDRAVKRAIDKAGVESLAIIFPCLVDPLTIASLCALLGERDGWELSERRNPSDRLSRVYLSLKVKVGHQVVSEALGFAPFMFMPVTRRAPFVTIELRTKEGRRSPKLDSFFPDRPGRVHLAGLDAEFTDLPRLAAETERMRLELLGGDDSAAKARVTFPIPAAIWRVARRS